MQVTLSFYVRSNLTGTFSGALESGDGGRHYVFEYTINSANTFERKSITIPGDTSGTWTGTFNARGMKIRLALALGANYDGTAGTWGTDESYGSTNQTNFFSSTSNVFYITGLQFEIGGVATAFEHEDFGTTLAKCQRYYQRIESNGTYDALLDGMHYVTTQFYAMHTFPVQMRAEPTMAGSGTFAVFSNGADRTPDSLVLNRATKEVIQTYSALSGGNVGTAGHGGHVRNNNDADTFLEFKAEL